MTESTASEPFAAPEGLDARGARLWVELGAARVSDAGTRILLEEMCRAADRLERLDAILRGDTDAWLRVRLPKAEGDDDIVLHIDSVLSEARQQQTTLQRLVAAVQAKLDAAGGATQGGSILDQLAERRAAAGRPATPRRPGARGG